MEHNYLCGYGLCFRGRCGFLPLRLRCIVTIAVSYGILLSLQSWNIITFADTVFVSVAYVVFFTVAFTVHCYHSTCGVMLRLHVMIMITTLMTDQYLYLALGHIILMHWYRRAYGAL